MRIASPKSLFVWDLDNTLTDTSTFWGVATAMAVDMTVQVFQLDRDTVRDAILRAPGQYRFSDFRGLLRWLGDEKILPQPANDAESHDIRTTHWAIREAWFKKQKEMTRLYPGALETLRTVSAQGAKHALYTDTEASSLIRRFWLLAWNAKRDGLVQDEMEILNLFDQFYAQPSIEDDFEILKDVDTDFVMALKERLSIFKPDPVTGQELRKPSAPHMNRIRLDFKATHDATLMLGDSDKDGGSAQLGQVDFCWLRFGAVLDPAIVAIASEMASPGFKFGVDSITESLAAKNIVPVAILQHNHQELLGLVTIIPGTGFTADPDSAADGSSCPHTAACPADQTASQTVHRLGPLFRSRSRLLPVGPATHFSPPQTAPKPPEPGI